MYRKYKKLYSFSMLKNNFPDTAEFNLISALQKQRLSLKRSEIGIGDDAALLQIPGQTLWCTDTLTENTHFKSQWSSPEDVMLKALVANLSDINAMGGKATYWMMNLGIGKNWQGLGSRYWENTLRNVLKVYPIPLVGGDTFAADSSSIGISVVGEMKGNPLERRNAKEGMDLYVSNSLGKSATGLDALVNGKNSHFINYHLRPNYPVGLGELLSQSPDKIAAIDLSDGLLVSAHILATSSGVRLELEKSLIEALCLQKQGISFKNALTGGEEFELLVAIDPSNTILSQVFSSYSLHKVGTVNFGEGVFMREDGQRGTPLPLQGYSHKV
jgi:thiamine-monophosphate kinase